jgi:hypothetical protein
VRGGEHRLGNGRLRDEFLRDLLRGVARSHDNGMAVELVLVEISVSVVWTVPY